MRDTSDAHIIVVSARIARQLLCSGDDGKIGNISREEKTNVHINPIRFVILKIDE
jgi:hypothetical protein